MGLKDRTAAANPDPGPDQLTQKLWACLMSTAQYWKLFSSGALSSMNETPGSAESRARYSSRMARRARSSS